MVLQEGARSVKRRFLIPIAVAIVVLACFIFVLRADHGKLGQVLYLDRRTADPSLTLIVPIPRNAHVYDETNAYLIDNDARVVHQWLLPRPSLNVDLSKQKTLFALHFSGPSSRHTGIAGECDELAEYDWNGEKIWSLEGLTLSHDFELLPNGNVAAIVLDSVDRDVQARWKIRKDQKGESYADRFIEVNRNKQVVWEWKLVDHLKELGFDASAVEEPEIGHTNSIRYVAKNPFNSQPGYLVSVRNLSRVLLIDRATKAILWSSAPGLFHFQHDASFLENGNILVFDNGLVWGDVVSRVVEMNPKNNEFVWKYSGYGNWHFMIPIMGGAQRLPNGNTLISSGLVGQVFEVAQDQRIVWNYILPIFSKNETIRTENSWQGHYIFRARKYRFE